MRIPTKKIVLVVEDNENINSIYKKTLENAGFEVFFALTGNQCSNLIKQHKPNLVLLDIMLEGKKNGFDVLGTLKGDDKTKNIPIFVMTNLGENHKKEALDLGAARFFVKAHTSLLQIVEEIKKFI